eukprot:TRINITY_DN9587_c0_g1_i1.p1 TRINITY_DN9587_c0_g1~~TRINITY_DN9587_c0_g1_i1.p1  ORF type:complete len:194 (-),score=42.07 TRINITY_DN9587_c0_g1_i1:20-601(-)
MSLQETDYLSQSLDAIVAKEQKQIKAEKKKKQIEKKKKKQSVEKKPKLGNDKKKKKSNGNIKQANKKRMVQQKQVRNPREESKTMRREFNDARLSNKRKNITANRNISHRNSARAVPDLQIQIQNVPVVQNKRKLSAPLPKKNKQPKRVLTTVNTTTRNEPKPSTLSAKFGSFYSSQPQKSSVRKGERTVYYN